MSTVGPQLSDRVSVAARAVWTAVEAVQNLTAEDLRDAGVESIAMQLWTLADQLEGQIEAARVSGRVA